MAFRLTRRRPISDQLFRIVRDELRAAREQLELQTADKEAIHEARKSLKKARAILRLLQDSLAKQYTTEAERLRLAHHALASLRDADVTVATVKSLRSRYRTVVTPTVAREVTRSLKTRRRRARANAAPMLGRARRALERAEKSAPKLVARVGDFPAVRSGTLDAYRRTIEALEPLSLDAEAALYHVWRKRVKDLWYCIRLFAGLNPAPRRRAKTLERLETLLGEDHDLATLRGLIIAAPSRYGDARTSALVLGAITKRQAALRKRALTLGHRTFAERPSRFDKAVVAWWRSR